MNFELNFFEVFAECSIALAGFGAIHAVLRGATTPRGVFRAWVVVAHSILSFVLSIVPLLLALTFSSDELLWRYASIFGVVGASMSVYSSIVIDIRMTRSGHPPQTMKSVRTAQLMSIMSAIVMLANFAGWPWQSGPFLYAVALVLILTSGLIALLHSFLLPVALALEGDGHESLEESHVISNNNGKNV